MIDKKVLAKTIEARKYLLRLLGTRPRTKKEMANRLKGRSFSDEVIKYVIEKMEKDGLVDDLSFSIEWIQERMRIKPRGKKLLRWELSKKGVPEGIIDEAFFECVDILNEEKAVKRILDEKTQNKDLSRKEMLTLMRRLLSRGFDPEIVRSFFSDQHTEI